MTSETNWNWNDFVVDYHKQIVPIYLRNEEDFDPVGIHGVLHVSRAVLLAECMIRYYHAIKAVEWMAQDVNLIRYAVAFHDAGRKANGPDFWENESAKLCKDYLVKMNYAKECAEKSAAYIIKNSISDIAACIVKDADVLEIMRPSCGHGGLSGFRRKHLHFLPENDFLVQNLESGERKVVRKRMILEAWSLIVKTDDIYSPAIKSKPLHYLLSLISKDQSMKLFNEMLVSNIMGEA